MSLQQNLDVLKKIEQVATLSGVRGGIDEDRLAFVMGFGLDQGRKQIVFVRFAGETRDGKTVVTFYSPCLIVKKGFLSGLSKEQSIDLLRRNAQLLLARYGVYESDGESAIVASRDDFLESLEPADFMDNAWAVAMAADLYEREHNQDEF